MALAVDTKHLLNEFLPLYERFYNEDWNRVDGSRGPRLQLHRVCVYATVTHDGVSRRAQFREDCGVSDPRQRAAMDWQAEQGDDEDEVEVLHHLKQLAATTTKPAIIGSARASGGVDCRAGTTTLVASVQSPTFTACAQHRPPSSFRRYSTRFLHEHKPDRSWTRDYCCTNLARIIPNFRTRGILAYGPEIVSADAGARYHSVIWLLQLDFFDLSTKSTYSPSCSGKRRRTLDPFHHISPRRDEDHTTRAHHHPGPETKRFKGVRYRPDHNRWVAEMKPPKSKNKVSFGEFRSQTDAARVVDVAFQHYGRPLNFPGSTPRILSSLPPSAGLSAEAKLELVRNQTEWMKSRVSSLPSPNPRTSDTDSGLRPFSAIGSSVILVDSDDADDAVSQPQPGWLQAAMSSGGMADGKETWGGASGSGDGPRSCSMQWSAGTGMGHDPSNVFGMSLDHRAGTLSTVVSSEPIMGCDGSMLVDFSTAPLVFPMWSPGAFEIEAADGSWEQESAVGCDEVLGSRPLDCDA